MDWNEIERRVLEIFGVPYGISIRVIGVNGVHVANAKIQQRLSITRISLR
jgi:hypothetical protein